jgi:hypothetical protein
MLKIKISSFHFPAPFCIVNGHEHLMYRFVYMNWFGEADGVSCDVLPKCLYLINTNKISFD